MTGSSAVAVPVASSAALEDRDRLIKLYGNGSVAVASFFRYTTTILPPPTSPEVAKEFGPQAAAITLVLEKRDGDWKIVHTHVSDLGPPERD